MSRSFYKKYNRRRFMHKELRQYLARSFRRNYCNHRFIIPNGSIYKKISGGVSPKIDFFKSFVGQDVYEPIPMHHHKISIQRNNISRFGKKLVSNKEFIRNKYRRKSKQYKNKIILENKKDEFDDRNNRLC